MLSILAKVREIAEFWKGKLDVFYEEAGEDFDVKACVNDRIKMMIEINTTFTSDSEIFELDKAMDDCLSLAPDLPLDHQTTFLMMNIEFNQFIVRHIRKLDSLQTMLKRDNLTYGGLEAFLDRTYAYFVKFYDDAIESIRDIKSNKSLAEILADEKETQDRYYDGLRSYAKIINVHKHAEDRIREYLDDRCFPAGSTTRKDILAILDEMNAEINAEEDAEQ